MLSRTETVVKTGGFVNLVLVASLSAIYTVFRAIPTFPMFGAPGTFRAGDFVAPLYGIILGPILGPFAVGMGTVMGFLVVAPPVFLGLDFLPGAVSAGIVGLATRQRRKLAVSLNLSVLLVFLLLPFAPTIVTVGNQGVPFVWLHLVGLVALASPLARLSRKIVALNWEATGDSKLRKYGALFPSIAVLAFIGTLAQHLAGGIITQGAIGLYFDTVPGRFSTWNAFWEFIFWIYPIERTIIAIGAALIATPTVIALASSRLVHHLPRM